MRTVMSWVCAALVLAPAVASAQRQAPARRAPAAVPAAAPAAPLATSQPEPAAQATSSEQTAQPAQAAQPTSEPAATSEATPTPATAEGDAAAATDASAPAESASEEASPSVEFHGAVEAVYSYNLNAPSNGVTAWRWYDWHHNTLGLQNALLQTDWNLGPVKGHVMLQFGAFTELWWPGSRSAELDLLWRLLQEVTVEWQTPHRALSLEGGIFNVPFGPEYNTAYLNWNWSTSNLFALMPYQIAGFRLNYDLGRGWRTRLGVYNGWDQIVSDNNDAKSVLASLEWDDPDDELNYFYVNYMVGDERDFGDNRGPYARHTLDVYGQWHPIDRLSVRAHFFGGVVPTRGEALDGWLAGALFARVKIMPWFYVAARGDVVHTFSGSDSEDIFHSDVEDEAGEFDASRPTLMGSGTFTLDFVPDRHVSLRVEARHDQANFARFYRGDVRTSMGGTQLTNASSQTTLTLGMTAWF